MKKYSIQKLISIIILVMAVVSIAAGCRVTEEPAEIILSFDKQTAYFTGSVALRPIAGDTLAETDKFEHATVILNASTAARLRLTLAYEPGCTDIDGLRVSIDGKAAAAVNDNQILFESASGITSVTLDIKFFLDKDTPESEKGKALSFKFVFSHEISEEI